MAHRSSLPTEKDKPLINNKNLSLALIEKLDVFKLLATFQSKAKNYLPGEDKEIKANISNIKNKCNTEDKYSDQSFSGASCLNRIIIKDEEILAWLTPDVLIEIFRQQALLPNPRHPADEGATTLIRNTSKTTIAGAIQYAFEDGLGPIKYMPDQDQENCPNYLEAYNRQKADYERKILFLLKNIISAAEKLKIDVTRFLKPPAEEKKMTERFETIVGMVDLIKANEESEDLLSVPDYTSEEVLGQSDLGFKRLLELASSGVRGSSRDAILTSFVEFCITHPEIMLDERVSHYFYDRLHLEGCIVSDEKVAIGENQFQLREILREMIQQCEVKSHDPENRGTVSVAVEQFQMRLGLVENHLKRFFPEYTPKYEALTSGTSCAALWPKERMAKMEPIMGPLVARLKHRTLYQTIDKYFGINFPLAAENFSLTAKIKPAENKTEWGQRLRCLYTTVLTLQMNYYHFTTHEIQGGALLSANERKRQGMTTSFRGAGCEKHRDEETVFCYAAPSTPVTSIISDEANRIVFVFGEEKVLENRRVFIKEDGALYNSGDAIDDRYPYPNCVLLGKVHYQVHYEKQKRTIILTGPDGTKTKYHNTEGDEVLSDQAIFQGRAYLVTQLVQRVYEAHPESALAITEPFVKGGSEMERKKMAEKLAALLPTQEVSVTASLPFSVNRRVEEKKDRETKEESKEEKKETSQEIKQVALLKEKHSIDEKDYATFWHVFYSVLSGEEKIDALEKTLKSCIRETPDASLPAASKHIKNKFLIDSKNSEGWTALLLAVKKGRVDLAELLLKFNANINVRLGHASSENGCGWPIGHDALMLAAALGNLEMVKFLITHQANPAALLSDKEGIYENANAMTLAADRRHYHIVKYLADLGCRDIDGSIPDDTLLGRKAEEKEVYTFLEIETLQLYPDRNKSKLIESFNKLSPYSSLCPPFFISCWIEGGNEWDALLKESPTQNNPVYHLTQDQIVIQLEKWGPSSRVYRDTLLHNLLARQNQLKEKREKCWRAVRAARRRNFSEHPGAFNSIHIPQAEETKRQAKESKVEENKIETFYGFKERILFACTTNKHLEQWLDSIEAFHYRQSLLALLAALAKYKENREADSREHFGGIFGLYSSKKFHRTAKMHAVEKLIIFLKRGEKNSPTYFSQDEIDALLDGAVKKILGHFKKVAPVLSILYYGYMIRAEETGHHLLSWERVISNVSLPTLTSHHNTA